MHFVLGTGMRRGKGDSAVWRHHGGKTAVQWQESERAGFGCMRAISLRSRMAVWLAQLDVDSAAMGGSGVSTNAAAK
eukprot:6193469-Pleurochrysis_carterae.AAC.3